MCNEGAGAGRTESLPGWRESRLKAGFSELPAAVDGRLVFAWELMCLCLVLAVLLALSGLPLWSGVALLTGVLSFAPWLRCVLACRGIRVHVMARVVDRDFLRIRAWIAGPPERIVGPYEVGVRRAAHGSVPDVGGFGAVPRARVLWEKVSDGALCGRGRGGSDDRGEAVEVGADLPVPAHPAELPRPMDGESPSWFVRISMISLFGRKAGWNFLVADSLLPEALRE